jgi:hypothetical protein
MLFKRKFFLDLSGGEAEPQPVVVAPVREVPAKPEGKPQAAAPSLVLLGAAAGAVPAATAASPSGPASDAGASAPAAPTSLTTAESIAAELAAAQAERPAPSLTTFAPECLTAGAAVPVRRRKAGANLAGFKEMAQGMMKN